MSWFGFGTDETNKDKNNAGTAMDNPYNSALNFNTNSQAPMPQWGEQMFNPLTNSDPYLNDGMAQASDRIANSDSYGGFGNKENTGYAGKDGNWYDGIGDVAEAVAKNLQEQSKTKAPSLGSGGSGGFSGGGGSFSPIKVPQADLSYLQPYTSPFTSGFKLSK
ncbi:MAG: hypothetical protein ACRDCE_18050 [Cetobacterium sp.]|uniref:hypothetical protein n=1 Tax=Cetobacterium sp. TaxID=2071632 RepID=UPI003EE453CA